MLIIISFMLILAAGVSILLITNKGQTAKDIKTILGEMYMNLKNLFKNIKDLTILLKDLVQDIIQDKSSPAEGGNNKDNESNDSKSSSELNEPIPQVIKNLDSENQNISSTESSQIISGEDDTAQETEKPDSFTVKNESEAPSTSSLNNNSEKINAESSESKEDMG